jgi:hypothetical protein
LKAKTRLAQMLIYIEIEGVALKKETKEKGEKK